MATVLGTDLIVKFGTAASEVATACATNCTLTIDQAEIDATCKNAEQWKYALDGQKSWTVTTDGLYQDDDATGQGGFVDLSELIVTGPNTCSVVFGGTESGDNIWTGEARLTSCTLNGPDNEASTYSATFMGNGPIALTQITP